MMRHYALAMVIAATAAACATTKDENSQKTKICKRVKTVGSKMSKLQCGYVPAHMTGTMNREAFRQYMLRQPRVTSGN